MLPFFMFVQSHIDPDISMMRADFAFASWKLCASVISSTTLKLDRTLDRKTISAIAKGRCYIFGQDYKRTLLDVVDQSLAMQGIKYYGSEVSDLIVDKTFKKSESEIFPNILK